jgi:hypothetical protein
MEHAAIDKFERFEKWLIENGAAFDMVRSCVDTPLSFLLMCFRSVVSAVDIALFEVRLTHWDNNSWNYDRIHATILHQRATSRLWKTMTMTTTGKKRKRRMGPR